MNSKTVFKNAKWIIVCKVIQSILQLIIGMLSARYLGPSNYGLINYAASIVAFVLPIMKLGFDATLVYELVNHPEKEGEIVGSALGLNVFSGLLGIAGVSLFVTVANFGDFEAILVCILYSISIFCAALEMIQYWFQYKLLSKYSSVVMLVSYFVVSFYKIYLLATEKSVYWFAISHAIEYGIISLCLFIVYFKSGAQPFSFSLKRGKTMLKRSKYYIVSALMVVVIQNTDHIMLTGILGKKENGFYSAAITSISVFQFVYVAIIDSYRPLVLLKKNTDQEAFEKNISALYSIILYLAILQGIVFFVLAEIIINVLYGAEYMQAVPLLRIFTFFFGFSVMGTVRNVWILAEEKQKYLWRINLAGAIANVVLNFLMIPFWGACGAATASLITQIFANFILGFIMKPLRRNNQLMLKGINPKFFLKEGKQMVKVILKKNG